MSDYRQHSPKGIQRNNIPGKCLRAFLRADYNGAQPTYGDLQAISRECGYEFNNASAAVSQLREILQDSDIGTVVCKGGKPGRLQLVIWNGCGFIAILRSMEIDLDTVDLPRVAILFDPAEREKYIAQRRAA